MVKPPINPATREALLVRECCIDLLLRRAPTEEIQARIQEAMGKEIGPRTISRMRSKVGCPVKPDPALIDVYTKEERAYVDTYLSLIKSWGPPSELSKILWQSKSSQSLFA